jgi:hypothetical protein
LLAIIKSGIELEMLIINNVVQHPDMDAQQLRSMSDWLALNGESHPRVQSAILTRMFVCDRQGLKAVGEYGRTASVRGPSRSEAVDYYEEIKDEVRKTAQLVTERYNARLLSPGEQGALFIIFMRKNQEDAKGFFDGLLLGIDVKENAPIYRLKKLLESTTLRTGIRGKSVLGPRARVASIVNGWNLYRDDRDGTTGRIRVNLGGKRAQAFPEPK